MAIQPLTGVCFSVFVANVVFMFNRRDETIFREDCQIYFGQEPPHKSRGSDLSAGAGVLN